MQKIRVAINGCGRIGRAFLRGVGAENELEIVAINDLADIETIAYLLRFDSVYGRFSKDVSADINTQTLKIDGKDIRYTSIPDPKDLPWKELEIDVVVEATGIFTTFEKAEAHMEAGAKRVVISAPVKDEPREGLSGATVLMGVNEEQLKTCSITSNASCTTNAGSPLLSILEDAVGIEKAILNTVHGYTASQSIVDGVSKKNVRLGRAGAQNIIPTTTGAAIATTKALENLRDKFDGIAIRVPVASGSLVDITCITKKDTDSEEINTALKNAANSDRWKSVFAVTDEPLVSSDILGMPFGAIADLSMTRVVGGNLLKVLAWYDNEAGYAGTLRLHVASLGAQI